MPLHNWPSNTAFSFDVSLNGGAISFDVLPEQFDLALRLLNELLTECTFDDAAINKVKQRAAADWYRHLDTPKSVASQKIRETVYKNHPYAISDISDLDTLAKITRNDIVAQYNRWMTPVEAKLVIVGDIDVTKHPMIERIQSALGSWTGR